MPGRNMPIRYDTERRLSRRRPAGNADIACTGEPPTSKAVRPRNGISNIPRNTGYTVGGIGGICIRTIQHADLLDRTLSVPGKTVSPAAAAPRSEGSRRDTPNCNRESIKMAHKEFEALVI